MMDHNGMIGVSLSEVLVVLVILEILEALVVLDLPVLLVRL
jgi:Tfp pilus assembly protein FimT